MTRKQKRSIVLFGGLSVLALAVALVLTALSEEVTFFRTPSELAGLTMEQVGRVRLGGLVAQGSVEQMASGGVRFVIEDATHEMPVVYAGILPDLFREGQGIIAEGHLKPDGGFAADTVLAKHDETYMPREVAESLKEQGFWQGEGGNDY